MISFNLIPYAIKFIQITPLVRYIIANLLVASAVGVRLSVDHTLVTPSLFLPLPIFISALVFGWRVGAYVSILSCTIAIYFLESTGRFALMGWRESVALGLFAVFCAILTWLGAVLRGSVIRLAAAEGEKDLLLRELNHRIGNDLAMASSLLNVQAHTTSNTSVRQALQQAANRIAVLNSVYNRLRRGERSEAMNSQEYVEELCQELRITLIGDRPISFSVKAESVLVPVESAITMGLIITELMTNAVKHAFPDNQPGHIEVQFRCQDKTGELMVCDDGVGLPSEQPAGNGFGHLLIRQLAEGHGGAVRFESTKGTYTHVQLPDICLSIDEPNTHGRRISERLSLVSRFPGLERYFGHQ